jgi:hypothetical protein
LAAARATTQGSARGRVRRAALTPLTTPPRPLRRLLPPRALKRPRLRRATRGGEGATGAMRSRRARRACAGRVGGFRFHYGNQTGRVEGFLVLAVLELGRVRGFRILAVLETGRVRGFRILAILETGRVGGFRGAWLMETGRVEGFRGARLMETGRVGGVPGACGGDSGKARSLPRAHVTHALGWMHSVVKDRDTIQRDVVGALDRERDRRSYLPARAGSCTKGYPGCDKFISSMCRGTSCGWSSAHRMTCASHG